MRRLFPVTLFAVALVVAACNPFGIAGNAGGPSEADIEKVYQEILALIGEAPAERVDRCRTIGVGAKPCGGPWEYLVYSTAHTDSSKLAERVAEHARLQRAYNEKHGLASDCMLPLPPEVDLVDGVCVAREAR